MSSVDRSDKLLSWAVAAGTALAFGLGASRSIFVGDSGELATAVYTLGIAHPSAYPLYILFGKLWTLLVPVGSIAFQLSLFSVAAAALACAIFYRLCRAVGLSRPTAVATSFLFAFGASFWSQANVQRVYALNAVFVLWVALLTVRWLEHRESKTLTFAFFLCGLGATNHTFMAVEAIVLGIFVLGCTWREFSRPADMFGLFTKPFLAFLAGLSPYLYLPIRSRMNPVLDWGNPESPSGVIDVILRRFFWDRAWFETSGDLLVVGGNFLANLPFELTTAGAALAALGTLAALRGNRFVVFALLVVTANVLAMALHGSKNDLFIWHRYYIPSYAMLALLAGIGWESLAARLPAPARSAIIVLPLVLFAQGFHRFDRSRFYMAEEFATIVLESLPPDSTLSASEDNILFPLMYVHLVEGMRPDVTLLMQGVGKQGQAPGVSVLEAGPLHFTHDPNWKKPDVDVIPVGLTFAARRRGTPKPAILLPPDELEGESDPRVPKDYLTQNLIGHFHYMQGLTFERVNWQRASDDFTRAARAAVDDEVLFYNLGRVYARNGRIDDAVAAFERFAEIYPRHAAVPSVMETVRTLREDGS